MNKYFYPIFLALISISIWSIPQPAWAANAPKELAKAVESIENLDLMLRQVKFCNLLI
jgi:hypothetical protein